MLSMICCEPDRGRIRRARSKKIPFCTIAMILLLLRKSHSVRAPTSMKPWGSLSHGRCVGGVNIMNSPAFQFHCKRDHRRRYVNDSNDSRAALRFGQPSYHGSAPILPYFSISQIMVPSRSIRFFASHIPGDDDDTNPEKEPTHDDIYHDHDDDFVEKIDDMNESTSYDIILNNLNDAQVEAVMQPLQSITRVVAGPGAGKTRVLTCRIAYLLKKEEEEGSRRNSRILAVTFTKKAASEMQHRLESLLRDDEAYQSKMMDSQPSSDTKQHDDGEIYEEVVQGDGSRTSYANTSNMITRVSLGTFHSICAKILRWNGSELSKLKSVRQYTPKGQEGDVLDSSFAIVDQSEQMRIIKKCLTDNGIDLKGGGRGQSDIRPITILNAVGQLKSDDAMQIDGRKSRDDDDGGGGGIKMTTKVRNIAEICYPEYRKALLKQNSLDFDDLILLARELLLTNEEVRSRTAKRWQHILVDEFQDTSQVQLDLIRLLATDSLLIVGDGDQSIYSWRGAHAESMADFVRTFDEGKEEKVDTVYLMENYRSTTNIVRAAQKVISNESTGNAAIRQDMKPMRGKGPSPRVLACADGKAEATFVVKEILKMENEGLIGPSSTVALIYRTNAQSRALEEACVAYNLKYLVRGSAGTFYSRAEIKDCLCFLKWIYNGRDKSAMIRAIKTPSRGLGDVSLNEFSAYCDEVERHVATNDPDGPRPSPLDILLSMAKNGQGDDRSYLPPDGLITKRTMNKLLPFAKQMNTLYRKAQSQTVSELLGSIIDIMSLKPHFDAISKTSDEFADRWANVMELLNASERYSKDDACLERKTVNIDGEMEVEEMSPLGNFLDDVSLLTETEAADEDDDGKGGHLLANLMTIHASKGMEFDAVFLVGNEEGTFPTQRAISEGHGSIELDEERRLCYVAMTRAKTHLVMTWRREVMQFFGQGVKISTTDRSRFLDVLVSSKNKKSPKKKKSVSTRSFSSSGSSNNGIRSEQSILATPKTKKRIVRRALTTDSLGLDIPLPKKKKLKKKKRVSTGVASSKNMEMQQRMAKKTLKLRAEKREEKEYWSNYHANKNKSNGGVATGRRPGMLNDGARRPPSVIRKRGDARAINRSVSSSREEITSMHSKPKARKPRREAERESPPPSPPLEMDSTMFFPVGSTVRHAVHGEGQVQKPPSPGSDLIYVQFDSGMNMNFEVMQSGLTVKY